MKRSAVSGQRIKKTPINLNLAIGILFVKEKAMARKFELFIECIGEQPESGNRGVVGVFLSEAWFKVLTYWLTGKLRSEGLVVTAFYVAEVPEETEQA